MKKSLCEKKFTCIVHSSLITVSIVKFTSSLVDAHNANALQESLVRGVHGLHTRLLLEEDQPYTCIYGNKQEDKEKKSPACRPGLWKGTDQMSISRCFLPSHYDTGRTWTEIKLNQVGCIKCLNLLLDWWSSLNLS
jgi:hypothetical protein